MKQPRQQNGICPGRQCRTMLMTVVALMTLIAGSAMAQDFIECGGAAGASGDRVSVTITLANAP